MLSRTIIAATAISLAGAAYAADAGRTVAVPGPTYSAPTLTGDLLLTLGATGYDGGSSYGLFDTLARVNKPLGGQLNLEIEAGGGAGFEGGSSEPFYVDAVAHLWGMHTPTSAWGVFGGATFAQGAVIGLGGVEAKHFLANGSFGAAAAVVNCTYCGTLGAFSVSFNHYFNPNHRIGVQAAMVTDFGSSYYDITVDVEHRFAHPIGLFAAASFLGGDGPNAWVARGGLRFYLDGPGDTIQSHETKVPWTVWLPTFFGGA